MFLKDQAQFLHTARFWTETYARPEASHEEVGGREGGREGGAGPGECRWPDDRGCPWCMLVPISVFRHCPFA